MSDVPGSGAVALRLWNALQDGDLLYLADDEQAAETTAEALRALAPTQNIVFVPSSDTLPGDIAPASPANIDDRACPNGLITPGRGTFAPLAHAIEQVSDTNLRHMEDCYL